MGPFGKKSALQVDVAIWRFDPTGGRLADVLAAIPNVGRDEDFAPVVLFMLSEGARFMTGQLISVNGGIGVTR